MSILNQQVSERETEQPDPQIDDSFTGIQARLLVKFQEVVRDRDRLKEYICTLYVNALRGSPELVNFVAFSAGRINAGDTPQIPVEPVGPELTPYPGYKP